MKSTVETLEPTKVRLTVEVPFEELKSEMDKAYKEIAGQVNIPGFRKGHVPPRIIDQRFGRAAVIEQVVNQVLPGHYSDAVNENDLRPMAQPTVDVTEIPNVTGPQGGQLVFTAEVDVVPAFELPEIDESIVVEVAPTEVTDEDVEKELEDLRGRFATLKTINRKAKTGDFATIDLVATINGEQVDSASDVSYEIGSGTMLDGQDTALRGTKAGDEVTFTSTLKGGDHEGEEAEVTITVKAMKARELPKADDDFAQMVSEFDTIDELKEDLKKQAAESKESQQALAARDALIDVLLGKVEIVLPESAVDHQVEHRVGEDAKPQGQEGSPARPSRRKSAPSCSPRPWPRSSTSRFPSRSSSTTRSRCRRTSASTSTSCSLPPSRCRTLSLTLAARRLLSRPSRSSPSRTPTALTLICPSSSALIPPPKRARRSSPRSPTSRSECGRETFALRITPI